MQAHVAWQMVGDKAVVMDLVSGRTVGLNTTASFIWARVASGSDTLVAEFASRFQVGEEIAESDVRRFVDYLVEQHLIVANP